MEKIKVLPGTVPKTVEDRVRALFEKHPEILKEGSDQVILITFNKDRIRPLTDPELSWADLDNLLYEAKQTFFANGLVKMIGYLIKNGDF